MSPFLGTWVGPDEYTAEVEYTVSEHLGKLAVTALDPSDGERAQVTAVVFSGERLTFTALWPSTGRVCDCILQLQADGKAMLTFTFTDHARLVRKSV